MQLTNYWDHPEHPGYLVFRFFVAEHADAFETMLNTEGIPCERHFDEEGKQPKHLFGVHRQYVDRAMRCNYLIHAKYRDPFIPNIWLRYAVLAITIATVGLAVAGYFFNR